MRRVDPGTHKRERKPLKLWHRWLCLLHLASRAATAMMKRRISYVWAACLALLACSIAGANAGLVISSDSSDLCASNQKDCQKRCAMPQTYLFMCNSGGTFGKPMSDCKCVTPPPAGVNTDGSELLGRCCS